MKPTRAQFLALAKIEPRLLALLDRVEILRIQARRAVRVCANRAWYSYGQASQKDSLRWWVIRLAGWQAENPRLRSEEAYDVAYGYLYNRLPHCKHCGCMDITDPISVEDAERMPLAPFAIAVVPPPVARRPSAPAQPMNLVSAAQLWAETSSPE
jgi:hypothetical protein